MEVKIHQKYMKKPCKKSSRKMMQKWNPPGPGTIGPECRREVRRVYPPLDYLNIIFTTNIVFTTKTKRRAPP